MPSTGVSSAMDLGFILLATLIAGVGSVLVSFTLIRLGVGREGSTVQGHHLLSFAAGALLATAFVHLLPEALEGPTANVHALFSILLAGLVAFFLLDKAELWHHGHERSMAVGLPAEALPDGQKPLHEQSHHHHHHHHGHSGRGGVWAVLVGDSVHCFGDGILVASAFLVDWRLGVLTALSVLAHEVPHHIGDLLVLTVQASGSMQERSRVALTKVSMAGGCTMLGGLAGYLLLGFLDDGWLPFFLVVAASSFLYVALADLIPQLQLKLTARETLVQIAWLFGGVLLVVLVSLMLPHNHDHDHGHGGHSHSHGYSHSHGSEAGPVSFREHPLHIERLRTPD